MSNFCKRKELLPCKFEVSHTFYSGFKRKKKNAFFDSYFLELQVPISKQRSFFRIYFNMEDINKCRGFNLDLTGANDRLLFVIF